MAPVTKEAIEKLGKQLLAAPGFDPPIFELRAGDSWVVRVFHHKEVYTIPAGTGGYKEDTERSVGLMENLLTNDDRSSDSGRSR